MRKFIASIFSVVLVVAFALGFVACKDEEKKPVTLSLNKTSQTIGIFEEVTLVPTFSDGETRDVTWTSSDSTVATVEEGIVTGVKIGTATVTATSGDLSATCAITVNATAEVRVETNCVDNAMSFIVGGAGVAIVPTVYYGGSEIDEYTVSYESKNTSVATVDEHGLVTPVASGETVVVVTANVGGVVGERQVSVSVKNDTQLEVASSLLLYVVDLAQDGTTPSNAQLAPVLKVNNELQNDVTYTYTVADDAIASINDNGEVSALAVGETVITVKTLVAGEEVSANINLLISKVSYTIEDTVLKLEKFAMHRTASDKTFLDLSEISQYVTKDTLLSVKNNGEDVPFEKDGDRILIQNQELGVYEYVLETPSAFLEVQCEYVTEKVKLLDMDTVIMPYRNDAWGVYSNYVAMPGMSDITQYTTADGYNWIKPATVLEGSAIKALRYATGSNLGWDPCAVHLSAAASFENSSEYVWGDAKYLVFDYMAHTKEGAADTAGLALLFGTNNQDRRNIYPGSDGYGLDFKGLSYRIYDENGNRKGFAFDEWNTFVVDLSGYTMTDFRQIIQIGISGGKKYMHNTFKNMRLVSSDEYMTDYAINDTTKYLDVMTSVTATSGAISVNTLTGAETRTLTWGTGVDAEKYYLDFGNSTRTTEKYFVYEMKNVDFTKLSYRINGENLWNTTPTDHLVEEMRRKGVKLKMYKEDGTETNAMGTGEWITYVWDLSTITENITSTSFFKVANGEGNTGKTIQLRNFRVSDTNPYA